ncbi:TetR/AcrR family transcriptional regulator [Ilumatobacter sp.]|uniref:TetR/AcrR family transcriptional regulator n=1 Tax=Ilumatobacter sp. TaxID=1967498 RepID=UPI003C5057F4
METDRRTRIADAIIETLARVGSRGLTHRAVDDAAGLPQGSTSYYLRTRDSLMDAAVARLAESDTAALQRGDGETLAEMLARVLDDLRLADRDRTLARYELALEAVRRPELRDALESGSEQIRQAITNHLAEVVAPEPEALAGDVMALFDGLLFRELTAVSGHRSDRAAIQRAIERMI